MEFEYTTSLFVSDSDLNEMCFLFRAGFDVKTAICNVSAGWDDCDYYAVDNVIDQIAEEIEKRLKKGTEIKMKTNVYVNWESAQVMSDTEALDYIAQCADDYSKNDGYLGDWLDENYTHTELWYMSDESRAEAEKNFQEACTEWAREDFERAWDRREIEV